MENKDIKWIAERYATLKKEIGTLTTELKELENDLKSSGVDKLETNWFKISIYETAPRKTFNLDLFKKEHQDLDFDNEKYYKISSISKSIKFTEKVEKQEEVVDETNNN